jgi:hypothetical protein
MVELGTRDCRLRLVGPSSDIGAHVSKSCGALDSDSIEIPRLTAKENMVCYIPYKMEWRQSSRIGAHFHGERC